MKKLLRAYCGLLVLISLAVGAAKSATAQQRSEPQQKESASSNEAALTHPHSNEGEMTELQKRWLDRIHNLERGLAYLESRTKPAGGATEAPSTTNATFKAPADGA